VEASAIDVLELDRLSVGYDRAPVVRDLTLTVDAGEVVAREAGLLSGGEQQMLAIARVLSRRPKLLMLDEMSLGLAPVIVDRLLPVVREFATSHGAGVLLVEQHVHLALKIADRGYFLSHGELAASGPAGQLSQDRALLAASYLGGAAADPGSST
jgi:branched-chain amino acid transport system ATP-binding protein